MLDSVRVRLTFWYTTVLALVLLLVAAVTYFIYSRNTEQRTDSDLVELSAAFITTVQAELKDQQGSGGLKNAGIEAIFEHRFRDHVFIILDAAGNSVVSSWDLPAAAPLDRFTLAQALHENLYPRSTQASSSLNGVFITLKGGRDGYRGFSRKISLDDRSCTVIALQSLHAREEMLEDIRATFAWTIPIALLLASVGGYFLARKSLAPVVAMSSQAGRIGAANLHERLPVHNERDELGHLAQSFNGLLDRLSESFDRQRRFMADASHELRTPVAILRGEAEVALSQQERTLEEYRESLGVLHQEAERLTHIVEDLFTLTRADAGQFPLQPGDFYFDELITECVHAARTLAQAKKISLNFDTASESPINADESLLRRMILNLLDNAIKYTPEGGLVSVSCRRDGEEYVVSIVDSGTGIPPEMQSRVFERFFRADQARSRSESDGVGAGLGLSISRWIAEAHHGRLELTRSGSTGSTFTAYLPVASRHGGSTG
jgi:two-component system, OmpR family, sensor kinase